MDAKNLKIMRKERGISQAEAARVLGVVPSSVSQKERNNTFSEDQARKLGEFYASKQKKKREKKKLQPLPKTTKHRRISIYKGEELIESRIVAPGPTTTLSRIYPRQKYHWEVKVLNY